MPKSSMPKAFEISVKLSHSFDSRPCFFLLAQKQSHPHRASAIGLHLLFGLNIHGLHRVPTAL